MRQVLKHKLVKRGLAAIFVVGLLVLLAGFVRDMMTSDTAPKKRVVQQISLLKPPPPPKPEEKPPEPEVKKEEVKIDQPQEQPETPQPSQDDAPAGKDLGVDAEGGAGGDSFGLIGKKGGRDLFAGGGRFGGYTGLLKQHIQDALAKDKRLRNGDYKAIVKVWLKHDGSMDHFELVGTSGNPDTDAAIKVALGNMAPLKDSPPEDMPQPIKLRITSRS